MPCGHSHHKMHLQAHQKMTVCVLLMVVNYSIEIHHGGSTCDRFVRSKPTMRCSTMEKLKSCCCVWWTYDNGPSTKDEELD